MSVGFRFDTILHQTVSNGFQGCVVPIHLLSYPLDGFLVPMDSNTLFNQSTSLAEHPPHERIARNFSASSAYCRLDCHCSMLPHKDKTHTTPSRTTKEKTLLDLMSKLCLCICSCSCSSCCMPCSSCDFLITSSCCKVRVESCA